MMQINRLFEIIYILLKEKTMTAKELAEYFGVSVRTIYRDIDVLSTANIPIYTNKGKGGGIKLMDGFVLDKNLLTEEEQNQILFALQGMQKISNEDEQDILKKISFIFQKDKADWVEVDLSSWGSSKERNQNFALMKQAILQKKVLEFVYYNSNGEESTRQAEPLQIYFKDKAWYLKAYAREAQSYRLFKITRMKEIEMLEETFERELPNIIERESHFRSIQLLLEISPKMAYRVYDEFEAENITKKSNGNFLVEVEFPENDWLYGYILSFGESAKVLAPEHVKKRIKEKLKKSLRNY